MVLCQIPTISGNGGVEDAIDRCISHPSLYLVLLLTQDPDERIYIIASYAPYARELLCEVSTPCMKIKLSL